MARVNGAPATIVPADYALMGVVVPPGRHDLALEFHPHFFLPGAILSILGVIAVIFLLAFV